MKALYRQVEVELKLFWRNRQSVFFTALLPILMMVIFGYLNQDAKIGNIPYVAFLLPGAIGMQVLASAFENLSTTLTRQRDDGILKRLGGTPLREWILLGSKMLTASLVIFVQTFLLIVIGIFFFDVKIAGSLLIFLLVLLTGIFTFTSMGFAISGLIESADTQFAVAHVIQWPMLFICGSFFPIDLLPELLQHIARVLPLSYFVDPLRAVLIEGHGLGESSVDLLVLLAWMICCFIVSIKTFRWTGMMERTARTDETEKEESKEWQYSIDAPLGAEGSGSPERVRELYRQVRTICRQVEVELKIFFRNRQGTLFNFLFPTGAAFMLVYLDREGVLETLFRFLFGFMNYEEMTNVSGLSFLLPDLIGYCIIAVAFEDLSPKLTGQRDIGILKRLGGTPLRRWVLLGGKALSASVIALAEILVAISIVMLFSGITIAGDPWWSLIVLITGIFTFAFMGFALAGLVKNAEAAVVAIHVIYIPMFLVCGAIFPIEAMPELLQYVAKALPFTYLLNLLRGILMEGNGVSVHLGDFLILLGWIVGCLIVSLKNFRWE